MQPYESLVQAAQGGDLPAFDELVVRFQDAAREWAFQVLGDAHLAEDAAQEAFLVAYHQLEQLRDPKAFPSWLKRIVISQCHRITRRTTPVTPLDDEAAVSDTGRDPAAEAESRELEATLRKAVAGLPAGERAVTELFYIVGYSQQEIAEQLQLPLTTVKKRLQYARERLKATMAAEFVAMLHLDDESDRFTGRPPLAVLPLYIGYTAPPPADDTPTNGDDPSAVAEFEALIAYLQGQQLIPMFE
jgi:RNA polymerase sigma factor (sigma-70 family)